VNKSEGAEEGGKASMSPVTQTQVKNQDHKLEVCGGVGEGRGRKECWRNRAFRGENLDHAQNPWPLIPKAV
jgi:hypothetical protein